MNRRCRLNLLCQTLCFLLMTAAFQGCQNQATEKVENETEGETQQLVLNDLKCLVVGAPQLGPMLARQWAARRDANVETVDITIDELIEKDFDLAADFDVVIYPPRLLGEFASRQTIEKLPDDVLDDTEFLNRKALLRHARTTNCRWGNEVWAVPLGTPQFVMFYRADVLEALKASVPRNWDEFASLQRKLKAAGELKDSNGNVLPTGLSLPLADFWRTQSLFAVSAPMTRARGQTAVFFSRKSNKPMFNNEAYRKALELLIECVGDDFERMSQVTPEVAYLDMLEGRSAIALGWPSVAFDSTEEQGGAVAENVRIARLPGYDSVYDSVEDRWMKRGDNQGEVAVVGFSGLVASVCSGSGNLLTAREFVKWLPSKQISKSVLSKSGQLAPFRASDLGNPGRWAGPRLSLAACEDYGNAIQSLSEETVIAVFPRVPGSEEMLRTIDMGVRKAFENRELGALNEIVEKLSPLTEKREFSKWLKISKQF